MIAAMSSRKGFFSMNTLNFGRTVLRREDLLSVRVLHRSYISGYDTSNRPEKGFLRRLFYRPAPIFSEADFLVARYRLAPENYRERNGITHTTAYVTLCRDQAAYEAILALARRCQAAYRKAPNDKRTTLERSDDFHFLLELGLVPSLVEEDEDEAGGVAAAWTRSRGGGFITYSYLQCDFDEFCEETFQFSEEWPEA